MVVVIRTTEIDHHSAAAFQQELASALAAADSSEQLHLDLRQVAFMDSGGIRALIDADLSSYAQDTRLSVIAEGPVRRVLQVTGLWERLGAESVGTAG
jgi:anti-anti-sigma factor